MRSLRFLQTINMIVLLFVGMFSFLRYSTVTNLIVPRKLGKVFSDDLALGNLSFVKRKEIHGVVAIDPSFASLETLRFLMYPKKVVLYQEDLAPDISTIVLKKEKMFSEYELKYSSSQYKVYVKK